MAGGAAEVRDAALREAPRLDHRERAWRRRGSSHRDDFPRDRALIHRRSGEGRHGLARD